MQKKYDVVIVGSGAAGLYASLNFDSSINILVLNKNKKDVSNSSLAQGGVAAVLDFTDDSFELHYKDTMIAGGQKNNPEAVKTLVTEGPDDVRNLMKMGFDYDKNPDGTPMKTLEGGHSRHRIVHHKDTTGRDIIRTLLAQVETKPNITLCENTMVSNINREPNGFRLDLIINGSEHTCVFASFVILASGGIGRVYKYTTNPVVATGDGIRLAYEMGARIKNISYIQFHPTAFNSPNEDEQFLISEAVRGEGAYLLNCNKERFMQKYDDRLELAPRDVVSRAIILESRRTGSNRFYLDITYKDPEFVYARFPGITEGCKKYNIDIAHDYIPVFPCQHYLMGGIDVNLFGETSVPRLYAAGECAHTGVHGGNRLASNSLLEALVFGRRSAERIEKQLKAGVTPVDTYDYTADYSGAPVPEGIVEEVRNIMQKAFFVMPDSNEVRNGNIRTLEIMKRLKYGKFAVTPEYCEALSLATVAQLVLREVDL